MIDAELARANAVRALQSLRIEHDPILQRWSDLSIGEPAAVCDVAGPPSYWLAPFVKEGRVIGFVRIGADGGTMAVGVTCRTPDNIAACPALVTGISGEEASARVRSEVALVEGEALSTPRFVHDGPPGREAWLVESRVGARPHRWFFVSQAGVYQRPAGVRIGEDAGRE